MRGHSVTWDHANCYHDEGDCSPQATFTCQAASDALCLNSCQECDEVWYLCGRGPEGCAEMQREQLEDVYDDDPHSVSPEPPPHPAARHCTYGHLVVPNPDGQCYAALSLNLGGNGPIDWVDARDLYAGPDLMPTVDGPIVVINNGEDGCDWEYPEAAS